MYDGDPLCDRVGQVLCGNGGNFKQQVSVPIYIQNRTHDASSIKEWCDPYRVYHKRQPGA